MLDYAHFGFKKMKRTTKGINVEVDYPRVREISSVDKEPFSDYLKRLGDELTKNIPLDVLENWIYRHSDGGFEEWVTLEPHKWSYRLDTFTNDQILQVDHVGTWMYDLKTEGKEYVNGAPRSELFVGQYMLQNGTFPKPIIIAENCENIIHPRMQGEVFMKAPYQLIEGHKRLACLLGMIESDHPNLQDKHQVWLVSISEN